MFFFSSRKPLNTSGKISVKIKQETEIPPSLIEVLKDKNIEFSFVDKGDYDIMVHKAWKGYGRMLSPHDFTRAAIKILYTEEVRKPKLYRYDLYIGFDYIDNPKYARLPFGYFNGCGYGSNGDHHRFETRPACNPNKKDFACFLVSANADQDASNLRVKTFHMLSLYKKVLSGGRLLNNIGYTVPPNQTMKFLSRCKFVIAYENQTSPGYITEKVFNAYFAGAVPIYYGHPSVLSDINRKAIIYAGDFFNLTELVEYIKTVDNNNDLYCKIYNENLIRKGRCSIMVNSLKQKFCRLLEQKIVFGNLDCNYY